MTIKLVLPSKEYLDSYLEACKGFKEHSIAGFHDPDKFNEWKETIFTQYENERAGKNIPEGYVPNTTFWLVDNGEFIGYGEMRHELNEDVSKTYGHLGCVVRYDKWGQGYGTRLVELLIIEAGKFGLDKVLCTCDVNNTASIHIIEKLGGKYSETVELEYGKLKHYWIDTIKE